MIWQPSTSIWTPAVIGPLDIPPSPPAERQRKIQREIDKETRPLRNRDLCPGVWHEWVECVAPAARRRALSPGAVATVSITAPTAFYRMDDVTDSSGNGLNLTNNGSMTFGAGKIGNCAQFGNSASKWLEIADNPLFRGGTGVSISFCGWLFWNSSPTTGWRMFNASDATNNNYYLTGSGVSAGQPVVLSWRCFDTNTNFNNVSVSSVAGSEIPTGSWHFLAVTFDTSLATSNNMGVSVNGVSLTFPATGNTVAAIHNVAAAVAFGARAGGALAGINAQMDACGFWQGHALTDAEVAALYNSGTGREYYSGAWH